LLIAGGIGGLLFIPHIIAVAHPICPISSDLPTNFLVNFGPSPISGTLKKQV
jgi:hypothetical protein